jgi:pimeloyl-ACP methyl ester carboxylesterase
MTREHMLNGKIRQCHAVTTDGVRIAYQVSGSGPAFVCCHAMANDHSMYDQHREVFSETHTFITFDQRGSGDSDHPLFIEGPDSSYTVEAFGEDLKAVLDDIGIERASVLGLSMGVVAALSFSTRWPDRVERLVLVSAMASRLPQPIIDRARLVEDMLDKKGINETYDFYFSGALFEGLLERKEFREQIAIGRSKATLHGFKGCFRVTIDRPSFVEKLDSIRCPTLILVGENDTHYLAEAELLERRISNAIRVVMPGVGHPMSVQNPGAFEEKIMSFLS